MEEASRSIESPPSSRPPNSNRSNHPGFRSGPRTSMDQSPTTSSATKQSAIQPALGTSQLSGARTMTRKGTLCILRFGGTCCRRVLGTKVKQCFDPDVAARPTSGPTTAGIPRKKESSSSSIISVSGVVEQDPARPSLTDHLYLTYLTWLVQPSN